MKITDTLNEQALLERLLNESKPDVPPRCRHLHYLLSSPFRYSPYPHGSRFRRAGNTPGVFYCAEHSATAIAELAFYRVLFFAESPKTCWPRNAGEYTGFRVAFASDKMIDLRVAPFDAAKTEWEALEDYSACQAMEELCRSNGMEAIRYKSVRDPAGGDNYALLACEIFVKPAPTKLESWKLHVGPGGVRALREFPPKSLEFDRAAFSADGRISSMIWDR